MTDTAFAPTVTRKPSRMRKTTADAAARAMELIELDGRDPAATLKHVGISRRSYERYIASITVVAPETARPLGGSQSVPAPLPLFDQDARLAAVEKRLETLSKRLDVLAGVVGVHDKRMENAADRLIAAADELGGS